MKLQNVDTNRKLMAKLVSSGGAFKADGNALMKEFSITESSTRSLINRFQKGKLIRVIGGSSFSEERLFILTDDLQLLAENEHLLKPTQPMPTQEKQTLECRAKQYIREKFGHKGLNRDVAVCVLKDFVDWEKGQ